MSIQIANAPCSWGIYEFKDIAPKYPYTRVLDEIAATGYAGMEYGPWGYLPSDVPTLSAALQQRGLALLSSFVPVKLVDPAAHDHSLAHALEVGRVLKACGAIAIVLADDNGTVPELVARAGQRTGSLLEADQWDVVAAGVNRIARAVQDELGLLTVFHHHCAGYVETPDEVRQLLDRVDPELVGLCLDTGHYHFGGGDAVDAVREHGSRIRYLHLKDCDPAIRQQAQAEGLDYFASFRRGVFCELGQGEVDFAGVLRGMEALGYSSWAIVEQDVLVDDLDAPFGAAQRNRDYLRALGY